MPPILAVQVVEEPDRVLADLILGGDEDAFRRLYRRHTPRLLMVVLRLMGGEQNEAEDVVQDTWLRAVEQLDRFRWEAAFGSWLTAIGLNVAREALRKKGRRRETELDGLPEPAVAAPLDRVEPIDLERAMAALPEGYRTVLVLHDVEGFTHEEIGFRLGVTAGTSKSQLFHARRALRASLGA